MHRVSTAPSTAAETGGTAPAAHRRKEGRPNSATSVSPRHHRPTSATEPSSYSTRQPHRLPVIDRPERDRDGLGHFDPEAPRLAHPIRRREQARFGKARRQPSNGHERPETATIVAAASFSSSPRIGLAGST